MRPSEICVHFMDWKQTELAWLLVLHHSHLVLCPHLQTSGENVRLVVKKHQMRPHTLYNFGLHVSAMKIAQTKQRS